MPPLLIHTKGAGILGDTTPAEVARIANEVYQAPHTVLHLHGGLVSKKNATELANRLGPYYSQHGLVPVFFVWESGLVETLRNNAGRIFNERIFQSLLKWILKYAGGKIATAEGGRRGDDARPLRDQMVDEAVAAARSGGPEPFSAFRTPNGMAPLTPGEQSNFEKDLKDSREFREAFDGVVLGLGVGAPAGRTAFTAEAETSLISKAVKDELRTVRTDGQRGLFHATVLVVHGVKILIRVVDRLVQHRDHGLYTTVVEEILRELYIDVIGSEVWGSMKDDTLATFGVPDPGAFRGGRLFIEELSKAVNAGKKRPKLSVVGHSAGSIFTCHLLAHVHEQRSSGVLPQDFALHRIAFLAPACQSTLWAQTLALHEAKSLWQDFRMYSLSDRLEAGYWEAPPLYPRSLLYLISGLLEKGGSDMPLLGMERYLTDASVYSMPEVVEVRNYLNATGRCAWSECNDGPALTSDALRHGGFADTDPINGARVKTMQSVTRFLMD